MTTVERAERPSEARAIQRPRHGFAEPVGDGIRRDHRNACPSTLNRTTGRRCECPLSWWTPSVAGSRRTRFRFAGSIAEARRIKRKQEVEAHAIRIDPPARESAALLADRVCVYDAYKRWLAHGEKSWSPNTIATRDRAYRRLIHDHLGAIAIGDLTTRVIEDWIHQLLDDGHGHRAVELAFEGLRAMLGSHASKGELTRNPALAVVVPSPPTPVERKDHLGADEYKQLLGACRTYEDVLLIRFATELGLRRGELCGLRWSDLDAAEADAGHFLRIVRTVVPGGKGVGPVIRPPKSGKPRAVVLGGSLRFFVDSYRMHQNERGLYAPSMYVWPGGRRPSASAPQPRDGMTLTRRIEKLMCAAGLECGEGVALYTTHDLRRSCASLARSAGVTEDVVQSALGHSTVAVTRDHYIRTTAPGLGAMSEALGALADEAAISIPLSSWIGNGSEPSSRRHPESTNPPP